MAEKNDNISGYSYAVNNPILFTDPFGLDTVRAENANAPVYKGDVVVFTDGTSATQSANEATVRPQNSNAEAPGYNWGYVGNVLGFGGLAYSSLENSIANDFGWRDKMGNWRPNQILKKGANGKYVRGVQGLRRGRIAALKVAEKFKAAGNVVGGLGLVVTGLQYANNQLTSTEALVDGTFGVIGFVGPYGAGVSATYFVGKLAYESISGNTLFEKPQNLLNNE